MLSSLLRRNAVGLTNKSIACVSHASQELTQGMQQADPKLFDLVSRECARQKASVNLIPHENYTSVAVQQAVGSIMNSKYSEGLPLNRYYGGNQYIDQMELLCQNRALSLFKLNNAEWGINVQAHSLSPANFHVLTGLLNNHDRVMSLALSDGGHLSHGQANQRERLSAGAIFFESLNYRIDQGIGLIDYTKLEEQAKSFLPKVIFGGADLYTRNIDYARLRKIADSIGATLVVDLGQTAGLVAAEVLASPFPFADIVTTATHKTLRGPRGALVFYRQGVRGVDKKGNEVKYDLKNKIENAIFPGSQGGPHNHTISGIAVALKEGQTEGFKKYAEQVVQNAAALADSLSKKSFGLLSGGSNNHLLLVDVKPKGVKPLQLLLLLEKLHIDTLRSTLPNGKEFFLSNYLALGTPAMTTRGFKQAQFLQVAEYIDRATGILASQNQLNNNELTTEQFLSQVDQAILNLPDLAKLQTEIQQFVAPYSVPGIE